MPDRVVISDTTPLLYLHRIHHLELLPRLYGRVLIPPAVAKELNQGKLLGMDVPDVAAQATWLESHQLPETAVLLNLPDLGLGESQVLALALHHSGCLVLMDDSLGRQFAKLNGIAISGTGGVLLRAKREGLISSLGNALDQLVAAGFWLDTETRKVLLEKAGEPTY